MVRSKKHNKKQGESAGSSAGVVAAPGGQIVAPGQIVSECENESGLAAAPGCENESSVQITNESGVGRVELYEGGVIVRGPGGRFLGGSHGPGMVTTREKSQEYARIRQQKAASRLRARLVEETQGLSRLPVHTSAEAVAEAGAMIWSGVVLNPDAYPRDRLEAWVKLGQAAGVLPSGKDESGGGPGANASVLASVGREALLAFLAARRSAREADAGLIAGEDESESDG